MPSFNINEVNLSNKWIEATKFDSKNKFINEYGKYVNETYAGRKYQLISKRERDFYCLERIGRIFLGILFIVCSLSLALYLKSVRNLITQTKKKIRFGISVSTENTPIIQKKPINEIQACGPEKLSANFSDFEFTGKVVEGTGSGECRIYRSTDGIEYVMKKNKVFEFYAGTLFQLMLEERSAKVLFARNGSDFYVGSQFEPSYRDIFLFKNKKLPEADLEGLALIIAASFILGEIDLKGLDAANSNVGLKAFNAGDIYFKIDHEQTFVFGGKYWRENYIFDENWKKKLRDYADHLKFELISDEYLEKAVQQMLSIPLNAVEKMCDFCEDQLKSYPNILKNQIHSSSEALFFGLRGATTIKEAVVARFQSLHKYASA